MSIDNEKAADATAETTRPGRFTWTQARKEAFLDHLAATCNVCAASAVIGVRRTAVYKLRRKDAAFRAAWAQALECGYEMLETQLVGHALAGGGPVLVNGDVDVTGPIDVPLALSLLTNHRDRMTGRRTRTPPQYKTVTPEQTDASILRKLKAMSRLKAKRA